MFRWRSLAFGVGMLALVTALSVFALGGVATAGPPGPPDSATVLFGDPNAGSPFPPGDEHDESIHAADKLVPRNVVISQGGTVTFETFGAHQVAVYAAGAKAGDIDSSMTTGGGAGCPPIPLIDDPTNRLLVLGDQPCAGGPTAPSFTFGAPGRYLVICNFLPHFEDADMFGWVTVK